MICDWEVMPETVDDRGRRKVRCKRPGCTIVAGPTNDPFENIKSLCHLSTPEELAADQLLWEQFGIGTRGPGTELTKLLKQLGRKPDKCGGECTKMARQMDEWGPAGCREHKAEIVAHLNRAYKKLSALDVAAITASAVGSGLALKLNPFDITGNLVDLAIERAEAATSGSIKSDRE